MQRNNERKEVLSFFLVNISLVLSFFFIAAHEMVEKDFSLLIGLTVALTVFLVVSLTSIRILRRKGRSPSMYTMTNLSKNLYDLHLQGVPANLDNILKMYSLR